MLRYLEHSVQYRLHYRLTYCLIEVRCCSIGTLKNHSLQKLTLTILHAVIYSKFCLKYHSNKDYNRTQWCYTIQKKNSKQIRDNYEFDGFIRLKNYTENINNTYVSVSKFINRILESPISSCSRWTRFIYFTCHQRNLYLCHYTYIQGVKKQR